MSQMHFVTAAYVFGLGAVAVMVATSFLSMRRAETKAEHLRAERRR